MLIQEIMEKLTLLHFIAIFLGIYTLLSESIISKEEIGNYQLLRDFDRTENAESALSKIFDLRYLRNYTFTA